jgi:transposase
MGAVVIGMDPHKRSATIEVMDRDEMILGGGRYATDVAGYAAMVKFGKQFPERTWAIEGCNGIGKHIANRLLADGELVVDVPPKLSARTRCSRPVKAAKQMPLMRTLSHLSAPG